MCFGLPVSGKQQSSGVSCLHYSRLTCAEGLWLTELTDSDSTPTLLGVNASKTSCFAYYHKFYCIICITVMCRACVSVQWIVWKQLRLHIRALSPLFFSCSVLSLQPISPLAIVTPRSLSAIFLKITSNRALNEPPDTHAHTHVRYLSPTKLYDSCFAYCTWWHISASTHFPVFSFHRPKFHHDSPLTNKSLLLASFSSLR